MNRNCNNCIWAIQNGYQYICSYPCIEDIAADDISSCSGHRFDIEFSIWQLSIKKN